MSLTQAQLGAANSNGCICLLLNVCPLKVTIQETIQSIVAAPEICLQILSHAWMHCLAAVVGLQRTN